MERSSQEWAYLWREISKNIEKLVTLVDKERAEARAEALTDAADMLRHRKKIRPDIGGEHDALEWHARLIEQLRDVDGTKDWMVSK